MYAAARSPKPRVSVHLVFNCYKLSHLTPSSLPSTTGLEQSLHRKAARLQTQNQYRILEFSLETGSKVAEKIQMTLSTIEWKTSCSMTAEPHREERRYLVTIYRWRDKLIPRCIAILSQKMSQCRKVNYKIKTQFSMCAQCLHSKLPFLLLLCFKAVSIHTVKNK